MNTSFRSSHGHALLRAAALLVLLTLGLGGSPASADPPAGCEPRPEAQTLSPGHPINLGQLKRQITFYRCTRYDRDVAAVLDKARAWTERMAGRVKKPAIVLDIDETSLSNWKQIHQNDYGYIVLGACDFQRGSVCGQLAWERSGDAEAIAPTLRLFNAAKAKGVAIFFVTGRRESTDERGWTEANLRKAGYDGWTRIYMRTEKFDGPTVSTFKTWARTDIEDQKYTIIANVGDQQSDLANGHALRTFKVPNPFYFIK